MHLRARLLLVVALLGGALSSTLPSVRSSAAVPGGPVTSIDLATHPSCRWLADAMARHLPASQLAQQVVARMTLQEKAGEVVLFRKGQYENADAGVPRLCIPALTLQDGPQGLAFPAIRTTQLPAPLALAATFDPGLARAYGAVIGSDAVDKGIAVAQSPDLNLDRIPENGRGFEGFGEDPLLTSAMGAAEIRGIQSQGVLAQAKHFAVYNQETDRGVLNDVVDPRALQELYLPPFHAAVSSAHVASVMCAYPQLAGTYQCQDGPLLSLLRQWGFTGFVRSDLGAVHEPAATLAAGVDLIKPNTVRSLVTLVRQDQVPLSTLDGAVEAVLTSMFSHGLIGRTSSANLLTPLDSHGTVARTVAERSAVLLVNRGSTLPLQPARLHSVAVIGADAAGDPSTSGLGSAYVLPLSESRPLSALTARLRPGTQVHYVDGGSGISRLPGISGRALSQGGGLHVTIHEVEYPDPAGSTTPDEAASPDDVTLTAPTSDLRVLPHAVAGPVLPSAAAGPTVVPVAPVTLLPTRVIDPNLPGRPHDHTTTAVLPAGWTSSSVTMTGTLTPPHSGCYVLHLSGSGAAAVTLDGRPAVADNLSHVQGEWAQSVQLTAGHHYALHVAWTPFSSPTATGELHEKPSTFHLGWQWVQPQLDAAAAAARTAQVAVVFVGDYSSEGFDRPSLQLPGDEDALIAAVAAANPHTVVVLHTGGPVLMPWAGRVAGVLEAWYPGQADGAAVADLLTGVADPGGHLPVTFPTSQAADAISTASQWPGVGLTSTYSEGLEVGYRWNHATGVAPLFPFGFGLSYATFHLGQLEVRPTSGGLTATITVRNTGRRSGTVVPQAYLTFPATAGEPPGQLVAFHSVALAPGRSARVELQVAASQLRIWTPAGWTEPPGSYTVAVGTSSAAPALQATVVRP